MLRSSVAAALAAGALAPAVAAAESIVYVKGGDVFLFDGSTSRAVTSDGGWESPSQADDGTLFAVKGTPGAQAGHTNRRIVRMTRTGMPIGDPSVPVRPDSSENGPFDAKASSDGRYVAFWKLRPDVSDYPIAGIVGAGDATAYQSGSFYSLTGHWKPFWIDADTAALFRQQGYPRVSTYTMGEQFSQAWFGSDEQTPTQAGGDVTRDLSRMVTVVDGAQELRLYQMNGPPPAAPTPVCSISQPVGTFSSPTWASSGSELAWADDDGIHVAQVRDWASCNIVEVLAVAGGRQPDWGVAGGPLGGTAAQVEVDVPASISRSRLRARGLAVAVTCPRACTAVVRLVVGGRTRGRASRRIAAGATRTVRVRARMPRGARRAQVRIAAAGQSRRRAVRIRG